jgi:KDO2-lipid IV(A) lauroyltransferase
MASLTDRFEYVAARAGFALANVLTPKTADRTGAALGRAAFHLLSSRRAVAIDNLRRAFGDEMSGQQCRETARETFATIGRTLFEIARFPKLTGDRVREITEGDSLAPIDRALESGNGAIVVSPHFGNWELAAALLALQDYPIDVLVTTQHNRLVDGLLSGVRDSVGIGIIRMGTALRQIFKSLKDNRVVAIAPDQHAPGRQLVMDFLGRPASVAEGPAVFSLRTEAPILPYCMRRVAYDRHHLYSGPPLYPNEYREKDDPVSAMTRAYLDFFEECIRKHPEQWMWTHRRWKIDPNVRNNDDTRAYNQ